MMKMPGLCGMAVVLASFLSIGNGWNIKDQNELAKVVKFIINRYKIQNQFSLAVNIPVDQDLNKLEDVFKKDDSETVRNKILMDDVYKGANVVAAKFKKITTPKIYTEHAEARVLDNINSLAEYSEGNFLIFYSYLSPCGTKCATTSNKHNILEKIDKYFPKWKDSVFVFDTVFDSTSNGELIDKAEIVEALNQLKKSKIGYIFRCYNPKNKNYICINCSSSEKPLEDCVKNDA